MTKNGQNMAKMEKIRNIQMTDNKEDKFFYFPMISMPCTGPGYKATPDSLHAAGSSFFYLHGLKRWGVLGTKVLSAFCLCFRRGFEAGFQGRKNMCLVF